MAWLSLNIETSAVFVRLINLNTRGQQVSMNAPKEVAAYFIKHKKGGSYEKKLDQDVCAGGADDVFYSPVVC